MTLIAAADGSALGNPGAAGWAWYINDEQWRSGGWPRATNNQGELMAVLSLLQETSVSPEKKLTIICDSQYVINAVTTWLPGWKKNNWRKSNGKPVLNVDLIKAIDSEMVGRDVTFEWIRGHTGHPLNEKADTLARDTATAFANRAQPNTGPGFTTGSQTRVPSLEAEQSAQTLF